MAEPLLTKRLHISGLTPSITPVDLERRLSSFGNVKTMDGFGARDALGDPRKFGFVTMEIGAKELARCLNVLSGSTWKGTKLCIGEAKPDFHERLARINAQPPRPVRPKRTHARNHGYLSSSLPLTPLSATAAVSTPGWIITPGRVVRPMRMRPERPLEPMRGEAGASKLKGVNRKIKKRINPPPVRARRRLIDLTKWDSVYLKGVFLDAVPVPLPASEDTFESSRLEQHDTADEEEMDVDSNAVSTPLQPAPQKYSHAISSSPLVTIATSSRTDQTTDLTDMRDEANAALAMLGRMFGDKVDWDGRESVDGIEDFDDNKTRENRTQAYEEDDIEIVPRNYGENKSKTRRDKGNEKSVKDAVRFSREEVDVETARDEDVEMVNDPSVDRGVSTRAVEPASRTNLKALFAPREDTSFSLVNHLDLGLDLEADTLGIGAPSGAPREGGSLSQPILSTPQIVEMPTSKSTTKARSRVTLNPSHPLLFPTPDTLPHPYTPPSSNATTTTHRYGTPSYFLFPSRARVQGLHHLPSSATFERSPQDTSESIQEIWEQGKLSLTREWKKAWRDARGSRRGRGAAAGDIGGGY